MLPLTSVLPKELLPINGKPNLEYILEECLDAGIKEFIFIISKNLFTTFKTPSKWPLLNLPHNFFENLSKKTFFFGLNPYMSLNVGIYK